MRRFVGPPAEGRNAAAPRLTLTALPYPFLQGARGLLHDVPSVQGTP